MVTVMWLDEDVGDVCGGRGEITLLMMTGI